MSKKPRSPPKFADIPKEVVGVISTKLSPTQIRNLGTVSKDLLANEYMQEEFLKQKPLKDFWEYYLVGTNFKTAVATALTGNRFDVLDWRFEQGFTNQEVSELNEMQSTILKNLSKAKTKLTAPWKRLYKRFMDYVDRAVKREFTNQLARLS